ncbi:MAG: PAS domain S-box protein [Gammaproteobacteria bacterium]|nr:PAS domain S-box protein [Gammaproteobacteria bacterium]
MSFDPDEFSRALVRDAPDAIVYSDADGIVRAWNTGAMRIFGYTAEEAIGRSLDLIIPENLRARHGAGYAKVLATGHSRYGAGDLMNVPALRKDGTRISVEFSIVPCRDAAGRMIGMGAILRDVTARYAELRELRHALAAREAAER